MDTKVPEVQKCCRIFGWNPLLSGRSYVAGPTVRMLGTDPFNNVSCSLPVPQVQVHDDAPWVYGLGQQACTEDTCLHCCKDPCPLIRSNRFSLIFWGLELKPCSLDSAKPPFAYVRNHPQPSAAVRDLQPCLSGKVSKSVTLKTLQLHIINWLIN